MVHTVERRAPHDVEAPRVPPTAAPRPQPRWHRNHRAILALNDALAIGVSFAVARRWLGLTAATVEMRSRHVPYAAIAFAAVVLWLSILALARSYDVGPFGMSDGGVRQVFHSGAQFLAIIAGAYYVLHLELLGRQLLVAMVPLSVGFTAIGRLSIGAHLRWRRRRGHARRRTVLVGSSPSIDAVVQLTDERTTPIDPVDAYVIEHAGRGDPHADESAGDDLEKLVATIDASDADLVVVTSALGPGRLRAIAWTLEGSGVGLLVATAAQPDDFMQRSVSPVPGLPLLHVERPAATR